MINCVERFCKWVIIGYNIFFCQEMIMQVEIFFIFKLQQCLFVDLWWIVLFKQIDQIGLISQGVKYVGISYKSVWDVINEMNQFSEQLLVDCVIGGKGGGGVVLICYGQCLIQLYDLLVQIQQKVFDVFSDDDVLLLDSLLVVILCFFLQISVCNQWFGIIIGCDCQQVQQYVEVLLVDGKICLNVVIIV